MALAQLLRIQQSFVLFDGTNGINRKLLTSQFQIPRTAIAVGEGQVQIATGAAQVLVVPASVTTPGWAVFLNLDDTNDVQIGFDVSAVFCPALQISALKSHVGELATQTWKAKAPTAAVWLYYAIFQRG